MTAEQGQGSPDRHEDQAIEGVILYLLKFAVEKHLDCYLQLLKEIGRHEGSHLTSRGRLRRRWPVFEAWCPSRMRARQHVAMVLCQETLYFCALRALDGGDRAVIRCQHGRRRPERRYRDQALAWLEEWGLKPRIRRRRLRFTEIEVSF